MSYRYSGMALVTFAVVTSPVGAQRATIRFNAAAECLLSKYNADVSDTVPSRNGRSNGSKTRAALELTARWRYLGLSLTGVVAGDFPSTWPQVTTFNYENVEMSLLLGSQAVSFQAGYGRANLGQRPSPGSRSFSYYPIGVRFSLPLAASRLEAGGVILDYYIPSDQVQKGFGLSVETRLAYTFPGSPLQLVAGYRFETEKANFSAGSYSVAVTSYVYSVTLGAGIRTGF